jgi:hypothetical protein
MLGLLGNDGALHFDFDLVVLTGNGKWGNGVGSHSLGESGLSGYDSVMPRRPRIATGGCVYHALNRAVGRSTIFEKVDDYAAFEAVLEEAREQVDMRLLAFCVMPNH